MLVDNLQSRPLHIYQKRRPVRRHMLSKLLQYNEYGRGHVVLFERIIKTERSHYVYY